MNKKILKAPRRSEFRNNTVDNPVSLPSKNETREIGRDKIMYKVRCSISLLNRVEPIKIAIPKFASDVIPNPTSKATFAEAPYANSDAT